MFKIRENTVYNVYRPEVYIMVDVLSEMLDLLDFTGFKWHVRQRRMMV